MLPTRTAGTEEQPRRTTMAKMQRKVEAPAKRDTRSFPLMVRVTPDERDRYATAAQQEGLGVGPWLRMLAETRARHLAGSWGPVGPPAPSVGPPTPAPSKPEPAPPPAGSPPRTRRGRAKERQIL